MIQTRVNVPKSPKVQTTVSNVPQVVTVSSNAALKLTSLSDTDALNPSHGALLQYDSNLNAWVASNTIERPGLTINCGNY